MMMAKIIFFTLLIILNIFCEFRVRTEMDIEPRFFFNSTVCGTKFECSSGECIDSQDVCNGLNQCKDGSDEFPETCDCGLASMNEDLALDDLLDLRYSTLGESPWHAGIYSKIPGSARIPLLCSGVLIYNDVILTAAHCIIEPETRLQYSESTLLVSLGKLKVDYTFSERNEQKFKVRTVVVMKNYDGNLEGYSKDLALIKLKGSIIKNPFVSPVCLWTEKNFPSSIKRAAISGWSLQSFSVYSVNLRQVTGDLMSIRSCRSTFLDSLLQSYLTSDKFCLTFEDSVTIKKEDSGGPVTILFNGRHYLVGILSKQFSNDYGLAIRISRYVRWIKSTTYDLLQTEICLHHQHFNCLGNSKCVRIFKVCDGIQDCSDNSDEDPDLCKNANTSTTVIPVTVPTTIKPIDFNSPVPPVMQEVKDNKPRCLIPDGVEIFKILKCGDSSGCSNKFSVPSNSIYQLTCPKGYGFTKPNTDAVPVICSEGTWIPSLEENKCLSLCKLDNHKTLELSCSFHGTNVACSDLLKPGTEIKVDCRRHYKKKPLVRYIDRTYCRRDGIIQHELSTCVPVCGQPFDLAQLQTLISNGETLRYAKYPWHVALYWKENLVDGTPGQMYSYKCGGTLIDSNKVLTAAHCVWNDQRGSMIDSKDIFVISGKLHSSWLIKDDWEQRAEISNIFVGKHYDGAKTKYSQDIAVLVLNKEIELSSNVMPACLDLDASAGGIPRLQLGHVVGWGSTTPSENSPSQILIESWMEYLDLDSCRRRFEKQDFTEYLHPDKFCALYRNGSGTQVGDSGGGMTFVHDHLHYIYGIVSVKKAEQNEFAVFTNILFHVAWLQDIIKNN